LKNKNKKEIGYRFVIWIEIKMRIQKIKKGKRKLKKYIIELSKREVCYSFRIARLVYLTSPAKGKQKKQTHAHTNIQQSQHRTHYIYH